MSSSEHLNQIGLGVRDSFDFWLSQHDISTPKCIEIGIEAAFTKWLDAHTEQIIEAIAARVRVIAIPQEQHGETNGYSSQENPSGEVRIAGKPEIPDA